MTTLIIARHGNTFKSGETPRRVGLRTDLPLTEKGRAQARAIGRWLKENDRVPSSVLCSELRRTRETAEIAMDECGVAARLGSDAIFNEIDYGPDENKTDDEVVARIGAQAIKDWDTDAVVPPGWVVDPDKIAKDWCLFGDRIIKEYKDRNVLVVTSNGIARFAPHLSGDFEGFRQAHSIKIATGALCVFESTGDSWRIVDWNIKP